MMTAMKLQAVFEPRRDFPLFDTQPHLAFLDSAASAQKPRCVIDAMSKLYESGYANIHRGVYKLSVSASKRYEDARARVARFVNAKPDEIIFTRNATESLNLVIASWGAANLGRGDAIILTELEHHANIVPWQLLQARNGFEIRVARIDFTGNIDLEHYASLFDSSVKMASFTMHSNALGVIPPVAEMMAIAKQHGALVMLDACQAIMHAPIDVTATGADFLVFSGHKLYGPTGIGVLFGRKPLLDSMPPYQGGGDMIEIVSFAKTSFAPVPHKFEAGTPAIAEAIGLAAAIEYLDSLGWENIIAHEQALYHYAETALNQIDGLTLWGKAAHRAAILSFTLDFCHPHDSATIFDQYDVAVRAGNHCAQPLMQCLGIAATNRASLGIYNTSADIDRLVMAIGKVREIFG